MGGRWFVIGWLYLVGVLAAAELGKMSALVPLIRAELGMGLTAAALLVSLLEASGATLGLAAGAAIHRIGRRRALLGGLALLAAAGIGQGLAGGTIGLLGWRIVESVGYLAIVIAAPLLIMAAAGPLQRGAALALWSSFVPVGIALGAILAGLGAELSSWRSALVGGGVVCLLVLAVTAILPIGRSAPAPTGAAASRRPGAAAWALALAFGCYALFEVGLLALLPAFLVDEAGASAGTAGLLTGLASLVTVLGSLVAAWQAQARQDHRLAMTVAIVVPAALLFLVFHDRPHLAIVATAAVLLNAISGIYPGLAFAMLPRVATDDAAMAATNGLFTQFGASGSLLGPPLFAAAAGWWGWQGAAICGAAASAACLLATFSARRAVDLPSVGSDLLETRPP